jgi:hypothetical protein
MDAERCVSFVLEEEPLIHGALKVSEVLRFQLKKWRLGEGGCSEGMRAGPRSSQGWL